MKDTSDGQWMLASFKEGGEKAFRHYYEMYYNSLCLFGIRVVHDEEVAMDIAQDVFVALWNARRTIASELHLKMFLYQAMRHRCMNHLRGLRSLKKFSEEYRQLESEADYRDLVVEEEVYRLVMREIDLLPEEQRKVIQLHLDGKGNTEIAEMLGISVNTVKTHKARARQQLRAKLKDLFVIAVLFGL